MYIWKEIIRSYLELVARNNQELWNIIAIRELWSIIRGISADFQIFISVPSSWLKHKTRDVIKLFANPGKINQEYLSHGRYYYRTRDEWNLPIICLSIACY